MKKNESIIQTLINTHYIIHFFIIIGVLYLPYYIESNQFNFSNILFEKLNFKKYELSYVIGSFFLFFGSINLYQKVKGNHLFNNQNNISDLYKLNWEDFEILISVLFAKYGCKIKRRGGANPDGGVDLEAYKNNYKAIIQCKLWKKNKVGVSVVREMYGVGMHEKANEVYIITCGYFTKEAKEFAKDKSIHLINGYKILELIEKIKNS